jgi:hypothetical protein
MKQRARMKAPPHTTSITIEGRVYPVDNDGFIEVDGNHMETAKSHGYTLDHLTTDIDDSERALFDRLVREKAEELVRGQMTAHADKVRAAEADGRAISEDQLRKDAEYQRQKKLGLVGDPVRELADQQRNVALTESAKLDARADAAIVEVAGAQNLSEQIAAENAAQTEALQDPTVAEQVQLAAEEANVEPEWPANLSDGELRAELRRRTQKPVSSKLSREMLITTLRDLGQEG